MHYLRARSNCCVKAHHLKPLRRTRVIYSMEGNVLDLIEHGSHTHLRSRSLRELTVLRDRGLCLEIAAWDSHRKLNG